MIQWNADDTDVIGEAIRYQITRRDRGDLLLPRVLVPLYWQTSQQQPNLAEVDFTADPYQVTRRRYARPGDPE